MTKFTFEDWHAAAHKYAVEHLDLLPFQIENMASDWAWLWEGMNITPQSLDHAYANWISGHNPYCKEHYIPLDGYDQEGQWEHDDRRVTCEFTEFLQEHDIDPKIIPSIIQHAEQISGSIGIFGDEKAYEEWLKSWSKAH